MQNILESTGEAVSSPRRPPRLVSRIFREYRNNFGLFWHVMSPIIVFGFLFYVVLFLFFKLSFPESQWIFSTSDGVAAWQESLETSPPPSIRLSGLDWGMKLGGPSIHIGFLWLAMCPLAYAIVQRRNGVEVSFKVVWQLTLRKTLPILGVAFLIGLLVFGAGIPIVIGHLISQELLQTFITSYDSILIFIFFCTFIFAIYFVVKWSLYNQGIIIENLSAIAALRRSSELVRGAWRRFCRIYLLLIWASSIFSSILLGLTIVFLSFAVPEFIPMREILLPGKFIGFFFFGYAKITLENAPNFWTIGIIISVHTLIYAILAPIWASLTTQLYMERANEHAQQVSS